MLILLISLLFVLLIWPPNREKQLEKLGLNKKEKFIGFFHPSCAQGGGGERVLWTAVEAVLSNTNFTCLIYTRASPNNSAILPNVMNQFGIKLDARRIRFLKLRSWMFLESKYYPRLTLILSSFGSMISGWEAIYICRPQIFVESVGYAFILPIAKFFGSKVVAYVHYPTVSSDMLNLVESRTRNFNNSAFIAQSRFLSRLKLVYYKSFSLIYTFVGSFADVALANSSWTRSHLQWNCRIDIMYPPCKTKDLEAFPLNNRKKGVMLSVGQFRPEKNHILQIQIISNLVKNFPHLCKDLKLVMLGGVRNENDKTLVAELRTRVEFYNLSSYVEIVENASYEMLLEYLSTCSIGIHTMKDEHFGIGIVEYMAAGLIPLAHNSGGPSMDIILSKDCGFLANSIESYASAIRTIWSLDEKQEICIRENARKYVESRFSNASFSKNFIDILNEL